MCYGAILSAGKSGISSGFAILSGYLRAKAQKAEGKAQEAYYNYLAEQSRLEGDAALKIGQKQSELVQDVAKEEGKQLKKTQAQFNASQIAAMAASGVDVSSVSAQDVVSSAYSEQKLDELALRYNADMRSWGVKTEASYKNWAANVQAGQYEYAGKHARVVSKIKQRSTLLDTVSSLFGSSGGSMSSGVSGFQRGTDLGAGRTSYGINVPSRYVPRS